VKVIYPQDGTIAQMEGVAIIKGGPNTENAKAFADYVSRKDAGDDPGVRVPARRQGISTSKLPGQMPQLADVKLIDYDEDACGEARRNRAEDPGYHQADALTCKKRGSRDRDKY
jgi:iron(III) transport system substrate-binding protein